MPKDEQGIVRGKEFRFPPERRVYLFCEMAKLLSTEKMGEYVIRVVPALGMDPAELENLATNVESQGNGHGQ